MTQAQRATGAPEESGAQPATPTRGRRPVSPLTVLGIVLLVAGVVCLAWVGWQYFGTNIISEKEAAKEIATLEDAWNQPVPAPDATPAPDAAPAPDATAAPDGSPLSPRETDMGEAAWLIRIPALGADYEWPVIAGVGVEDLKKGVGWYPTTGQPGEVGNFALAGHRVTNGEPFRRMLELQVGDTIIIESRDSIFTYELTSAPGQLTVQDTESWVLDPVPGNTDVQPSESLITLTTCEDLFHSPDRSVAFGKLVASEAK